MAAEGGEYTREKEKNKKQQVATGGAEQERKGAPRCVRVSVPVRPDLCLSDRQRRERRTRERGRSHSAKTRREKFACPKPEPDSNPGGWGVGGCIVKSSQHAGGLCLQVKPRERERKREKKKKRRQEKERKENNTLTRASKQNSFQDTSEKRCPKETQLARNLRQKELSHLRNIRPRQRKKRAQAQKEQHSVLFSIPRKDRNNPRGVQQILSRQLSKLRPKPRRTLPKQTIKETNSALKRERGKRAALCAVSKVNKVPSSSRLGSNRLRDENSTSRTLSQGELFEKQPINETQTPRTKKKKNVQHFVLFPSRSTP